MKTQGIKTIDATGNDNDGKINGGKWVTGKFKSALEFNGKGSCGYSRFKIFRFGAGTYSFCLGQFSGAGGRCLEELGSNRGGMRCRDHRSKEVATNVWAGGNWQNCQAVGGPNLEVGVWYFMVGAKLPDVGLEAYLDGEKIATGNKR